jgi:hypothetical protein
VHRVLWSPEPGSRPGESLDARAFGVSGGDLAVDFDQPLDRALTSVLSACVSIGGGQVVRAAEVHSWHVLKRRQALLAVAVATHGPSRDVTVRCSAPGCGERMDLQIDLMEFASDWRRDRVAIPGRSIVLRLPRPEDLADPSALPAGLVVEGEAGEEDWFEEADAALGAADPQGDLELQAICPECGAPVHHPFALEPFLMAELAGELGRLVDEIHVLAMAYHWSEAEIMALPASRRALYLERIREAWAA